MMMDLFVARTMTTRASLEFCGALDLSLPEVIYISFPWYCSATHCCENVFRVERVTSNDMRIEYF